MATFRAQWQPQNSALNPIPDSFLPRLASRVKNCLFYLPHSLIAAIINPRRHITPVNAPNDLSGQRKVKIVTPDQVEIQATFVPAYGCSRETPTMILFNPLGNNYDIYSRTRVHLMRRDYNVVSFNYRGYRKTWSAGDLVLDGESVYQYVRDNLGVNPRNIHFFGASLGGAVAAQVKALHPECTGKYVGDRPFKSIFTFLVEKLSIGFFGKTVKVITRLAVGIFLAYPVYLLGWELDGERAINRMRGDHLVTYHPNDPLIPFRASLATCCRDENRLRFHDGLRGYGAHGTPLYYLRDENGRSELERLDAFLEH